ncbi:unnamed protein product [Pleuronectes platessa]|uniref:Uncharacterized protein n=1 Tax=Pleuronectes platessa TaxID=8262 RepID=A0A9N7YAQ3_PLEPL|nr:unnamed protein product [Pleuronectes platessa]
MQSPVSWSGPQELTLRVVCECSQKMAMVSGYCSAVGVGGLAGQRLGGGPKEQHSDLLIQMRCYFLFPARSVASFARDDRLPSPRLTRLCSALCGCSLYGDGRVHSIRS